MLGRLTGNQQAPAHLAQFDHVGEHDHAVQKTETGVGDIKDMTMRRDAEGPVYE